VVMLVVSKKVKTPVLQKATAVASRIGAVVAMVAPVFPVWAFVSGMPPAGAERLLPLNVVEQVAPSQPGDLALGFDVPAGSWRVVESKANLVAARVSAGKETFDAKFGPVTGEVALVPDGLVKSTASFGVSVTSVDTGVELRNSHAQDYMSAKDFPSIALILDKIDAVGPGNSEASRSFSAVGSLTIMGKTLPVPLSGSLALLTAAERSELGVDAPHAILVNASFILPVLETPLDRSNFDVDQFPLTVRLVIAPPQ